jgi:hypothetical protein
MNRFEERRLHRFLQVIDALVTFWAGGFAYNIFMADRTAFPLSFAKCGTIAEALKKLTAARTVQASRNQKGIY